MYTSLLGDCKTMFLLATFFFERFQITRNMFFLYAIFVVVVLCQNILGFVLCRNCCSVFVCFVCFLGLCICSCNLFCFVNLVRAETVSCYFIRVCFLCVLFLLCRTTLGKFAPTN